MDEVIISKAITESYMKDFLDNMEVDVAIVGAGPSEEIASQEATGPIEATLPSQAAWRRLQTPLR